MLTVGFPAHREQPASLANLLPQIDSSVKDAYFHPERGCWVVWLRDDSVVAGSCATRLGEPTVARFEKGGKVWDVRFPANTLFLPPRDILVTESFQYMTPQGPVRPTVPARCEYLDLIRCVDGVKRVHAGTDLSCKVRLVGGLDLEWVLPENKLTPIEKVHVEVWPNLSHPDWKRFWLAAESDETDPIKKVRRYAVFEKSEHGYYRRCSLTSSPQQSFYESFLGRPRLLWVGNSSRGVAGAETWSSGGGFTVFNDSGRYPDAGRAMTLAVDFGSSHTVLLVADPEGMEGTSFKGPGAALDACRRVVVSNEKAAEATRSQETVLPPIAAFDEKPTAKDKATGHASQEFGSTLLYPRDGHVPDEQSIPFRDYTIPVRLMECLDEYPNPSGKPDEALKWASGSVASSARKAYLKAILTIGAVEAFSRWASRLNVRHSFPLGRGNPEEIRDAFAHACAWLGTDVLDKSSNKTEVCHQVVDSEFRAAMTAAHAYGQWVLALDLGANTLDLALFADEDGRHKAKAWDSVMLGGNLVADALVVRTKTNERWLRWELSEGRLQADKDLIQDADLLLRLSMEYAARFVAGSLLQLPEVGSGDPIPLRVVLLGSGWRWYQFVSQQRKRFDEKGFDERFGAYLAKRIDALGGEPLRGRVTVAISAGLLVSGEGRCQEDSRGWCCSVAYGAWSAAGHEALAVAQGLARMAPGLVEPKPGIEAPNGLCESGRPWTQMVGKNHPLGRPKSVSADPSFDDDLERIAPLQRLAHGATNMEVLYELARCTEVDQTRTRTALGLAFEALSAQWFGLDRKQEGTPEPVAVPADKNG